MTILVGSYVGATSCTGSARPGTKALMAWYLGVYGGRGGRNLGIYNCRNIAGSNTLSLHAEGRAGDLGTPVGNSWSWALAEQLRLNSKELGIQLIVHQRKVWSSRRAHEGWRVYTGSNPHDDHLHVELTPAAAATLTVETINETLADPEEDDIVAQLPVVRLGHHSTRTVKTIQAIVNRDAAPGEEIREDGVWGPKTDVRVRAWQVAGNVPNSVRADGTGDGIWGPRCWEFALDLD